MKKLFNSFRVILVMATIAIIGVGCGTTKIQTYSGSERPQEEIAMLNCDSHLSVKSVDENSAYNCSTVGIFGGGCEIRLLPGYHTITASYSNEDSFSISCLGLGVSKGGEWSSGSLSKSFNAKAGGRYRLTYEIFGTQWRLLVKEADQK